MTQQIQSHLNLFNDLNTLVKIIKHRQENHIALTDYIRKISEPNTNQNIFLDEESRQHKKYCQDLAHKQADLNDIELKLRHRWPEYKSLDTERNKLLYKSVQRILEICQNTVQKIKIHQQLYEYQFKIFKEKLLKSSNPNNIMQFVELIISYSSNKILMDKVLLEKLIQIIQNGEKETMKNQIENRYSCIKMKIEQERLKMIKLKEEQVRINKQRQRQKDEQKFRIEQKLKLAAETLKILNKNRKKIAKFSDNVLSKLYYPLVQLSRCQFAEDMLYTDQNEHKEKLMKDLKERNKLVQSQIVKFVSYHNNIQSKIKVLTQKQDKHQSNSSPKFSINHRVVSSKQHSISNVKISKNYSSIQTVPELPTIKKNRPINLPMLANERLLLCYSPNQSYEKVDENVEQIKNMIQQKTRSDNPNSPSIKPISIFESLKFPSSRRKQSTLSEGLPQINMCERVGLQMNKIKVVLHSRNTKVFQLNKQNKRRSETPQMLAPLIQISIPSKYSSEVTNAQNSSPIYNLKELIKS